VKKTNHDLTFNFLRRNQMKKSLLIMLVFGISLFISSMAFAAPNHGDPDACRNYEGTDAWNDCNAYCFAKNCASDDPQGNPRACANNKENFLAATGAERMPCAIVACALCADPDPVNQQNTVGICEEMKDVDCPEDSLNVGEVPCSVVTIPADVAPGCSEIPPSFGLIPNCQYTGPGFVCNLFIGGVLLTTDGGPPSPPGCIRMWATEDTCTNLAKCPAPPSCF
jgi:hypothetical protein